MENIQERSPQETLQLIESMINKAQNRFGENGVLYLLWGWVILGCSLLHYSMIRWTDIKNPELIWFTTLIAAAYQIFYLARQVKKQTVRTYTDEIISYVWIVFGISGGIATFILGRSNTWISMYPMILMLYGMPTFLSGAIMRFQPLMFGAVVCWILAVVATFIDPLNTLLLVALAVIAAWIIPGYILKMKYKAAIK
ncbi:MAG: hypothetical protein ACKO1T_11730 [Sediminibacterium sp.]